MRQIYRFLCSCLFIIGISFTAFAQLKPGLTGTFAATSDRAFTLTDNSFPVGTLSFSGRVFYPSSGPGTGQNEPVANGPFPVITFGHGFNITYLNYNQIVKHLASWGYIVIVPDVQNGFSVNHATYAQSLAACCKYIVAQNLVAGSPYEGKVIDKTACVGHSMGGGATFLVPGYYPDVDAVAGLSAAETNPSAITALATVTTPFQVISGTADGTAPENTNQTPMYNAAIGPKQWVSLIGGAHCKYTDGNTVCDLVSAGGSLTRATQIYQSKKYLTAFFQYYLKNDYPMRAFLCGDSVQADAAAAKITYQTTIVCPNCNGLSASITPSGSTALCAGQSVTLDGGSGNLSYLWSNGATTQTISVDATQAGSYSLTVVDAQTCQLSAPAVTVTNNSIAPFTIQSSGGASICSGGSLTLSAPTGFAGYLWSNGATSNSITVSASGSYTVTATNAAGCTYSPAAFAVTQNSAPTPTISGSNSFCAGGSTTLSAPAGFASYLWSNGATTQTISVSAAGSFTVSVTDASGCSGTSAAFVVSLSANLNPTISGNNSICSGASTTLSAPAGLATYLWSNGATTQTISVNAAGSFTVSVTDASGCSGMSAAFVVSDNSPATPVVTAGGSTSFCAGGSVSLSAPAGLASYLWSNGATTQNITVSAAGNYSVTVTNASGCTATSSATTVSIVAAPSPTVSAGGSTNLCTGGSVVLTASSANSYLWSNGATTQSITVSTAGNYSVSVTNAGGCTGTSAPTAVTVSSNPTVAITSNGGTTICSGQSVTLSATSGLASYLWSNGATTSSITVSAAGTYSVTGTNSSGCSATAQAVTVSVENLSAPTISANGATTFCAGGSVTLNASAGFASYLWSNGATTASISATAAGNYTVTATSASGCTYSSAAQTVTVNPAPSATITPSGATNLCNGASVTLSATPQTGATYLWSNGATTPDITVSTTGNYILTVTSNGCTATSSPTAVSVNSTISPTVTASSSVICGGGSVTLSAQSGFATYSWSNGATTPSITVSQAGTYTVSVTAAGGCGGSSAPFVVTSATAPSPTITVNGSANACAGASVSLSAPAGFANYVWSDGQTGQTISVTQDGSYNVTVTDANGCSGSAAAPTQVTFAAPLQAQISSSAGAEICPNQSSVLSVNGAFASYLWDNGSTQSTIAATSGGNYNVVVTDANGCTGTATFALGVINVPTLDITGSTTICSGSSVTLTASNGFTSYQWSNGETTQSITLSAAATVSVTGTTNGCSATSAPVSVVLSSGVTPNVTAPQGLNLCNNQGVTLDAGAGFDTYLWSNGSVGQTLAVTTAGTYTVTVTQNGCTGTSTAIVVTNGGSPNPVIVSTGSTTICAGGSVSLGLTETYDSYLWSNGATTATISAAAAGNYFVTVTQNGCTGTSAQSVTVAVNPAPAQPTISQTGNTLNASTATGYQWNTAPANTPIAGAIGQTFNPTASGQYSVTVTDANGCSSVSDPFNFTLTSRAESLIISDLTAYPNPTNGQTALHGVLSRPTAVSVRVYNDVGQLVTELPTVTLNGQWSKQIDLSRFAVGVYQIAVQTDGQMQTVRIVKQ